MLTEERWSSSYGSLSEHRVTLRRLGAPLLYAYDAYTFWSRLRGVHSLPPLGPTDALIIRPCRVIHTYGLDIPIDVAFMDREGYILKLDAVLQNRIYYCWQADVALEMASGTAKRLGLGIGQRFVPSVGRW